MAQELPSDDVGASALLGQGDRLIPHSMLLGIAEGVDVGERLESHRITGAGSFEPGACLPFGREGTAKLVEGSSLAVGFHGRSVTSAA